MFLLPLTFCSRRPVTNRLLISGTPTAFRTEDLRAHTNYAGGYAAGHELIKWFWEVIDSFDDKQKSMFLRFATSCSRAPLLGFGTLYPKVNVSS